MHAGQAIALQPADRQADFLLAQQRRAFPKLSALELQEMQVPAASICETYAFDKERTLANLPLFLHTRTSLYSPDVVTANDAFAAAQPWMTEHGAPYLVYIAGNALRAAELARTLRTLLPAHEARPAKRRKGAEAETSGVAKLFARHFKVKEQAAHLRAHPAPIAVGTPHRIQQLLADGALRTDHLHAIVLDHSWTDAKLRTIFDTPETRDALVALLSDATLHALFQRKTPCRLALY